MRYAQDMHFVHKASLRDKAWPAAIKHVLCTLAVPAFFQPPSMALDHTFSQQPEKVGKKGCSPANLPDFISTLLIKPA